MSTQSNAKGPVVRHVQMPPNITPPIYYWLAIGESFRRPRYGLQPLRSAATMASLCACGSLEFRYLARTECWLENNPLASRTPWCVPGSFGIAALCTCRLTHLPTQADVFISALRCHKSWILSDNTRCKSLVFDRRKSIITIAGRQPGDGAEHKRRSGGDVPELVPDANRWQLVRSVPRGVREFLSNPRSAALTFTILTGREMLVTTFWSGRPELPLTRPGQVKEDPFIKD